MEDKTRKKHFFSKWFDPSRVAPRGGLGKETSPLPQGELNISVEGEGPLVSDVSGTLRRQLGPSISPTGSSHELQTHAMHFSDLVHLFRDFVAGRETQTALEGSERSETDVRLPIPVHISLGD